MSSVVAIMSGALMGIGFIFPLLWPCVFVGVALFVVRIPRTGVFWYGYLAGTTLYALVLAPTFLGALPLDWFGISHPFFQIVAAGGSWLLAVAVFSSGVGSFTLITARMRTDSWFDLLLIPSIWVLAEVAGVLIFNAVTYGPGSFFGAHISVGWLGYLLANDVVLLQLASIGGIYALSFTIVFIGVACAYTVQDRRYGVVLGMVLICWALGHMLLVNPTSSGHVKVAVLSRYEPPLFAIDEVEEAARQQRVYELITPLENMDVVIFPENSAFLRVFTEPGRGAIFRTLQAIGVGGHPPLVIDSEDIGVFGGPTHSRVSFWNGTDTTYFGYKQLLMPLGEYVPYLYAVILTIFGGGEMLSEIEENRGYEPGKYPGVGTVSGNVIAVRFCDESMSPELFRVQTRMGANMLANISSLSWFHGSPLVYEQMKRVAQVRAVENGRWVVQSGNMAPAFAIDAQGRVVGETPRGEPGALVVDVVSLRHMTPYTQGGVFLLCIPLLIVAGGLVKRVQHA